MPVDKKVADATESAADAIEPSPLEQAVAENAAEPCAEPLEAVAPAAVASVPPTAPPQVNMHAPVWIYLDEAGEEQGPFPAAQLKDWYSQTIFPPETKVNKGKDGEFGPMSECVPITGAPMPTPPEDEKVKRNIEMVAQKAAENPALLEMDLLFLFLPALIPARIPALKEKKKEDPNFSFLRGGDGENYYTWCLTSAREAWAKKQQEAYAATMATQAAAAAAAAANPRPAPVLVPGPQSKTELFAPAFEPSVLPAGPAFEVFNNLALHQLVTAN